MMLMNKFPSTPHFMKELCTIRQATNVPNRAFFASNVCQISSIWIPIKYNDFGCPTISIVIGHHTIYMALIAIGANVNVYTSYWVRD